MTNNIEQLEKLVEARKKATAGEWGSRDWRICASIDDPSKFQYICDTANNKTTRTIQNKDNATFIALAGSTNIQAILDEMKEQQAKIEKLEKVAKAAKWVICDASGVNKNEDCDWLVSSDAMNDLDQTLAAIGEQR